MEDSDEHPIVEGTVSVELGKELRQKKPLTNKALYDETKDVDDLKYIPHLLKASDSALSKKLLANTAEFELTVTFVITAKYQHYKIGYGYQWRP